MRFTLHRVRYMPRELMPGVLYVSEEFDIAIHLCACGCGEKVKTPLGPTEWSFQETDAGPTLRPSIGNWFQPCKTHYLITEGNIVWAEQWTPEEIAAGRSRETERRAAYYEGLYRRRKGPLGKLWQWLSGILRL